MPTCTGAGGERRMRVGHGRAGGLRAGWGAEQARGRHRVGGSGCSKCTGQHTRTRACAHACSLLPKNRLLSAWVAQQPPGPPRVGDRSSGGARRDVGGSGAAASGARRPRWAASRAPRGQRWPRRPVAVVRLHVLSSPGTLDACLHACVCVCACRSEDATARCTHIAAVHERMQWRCSRRCLQASRWCTHCEQAMHACQQ